MHLARPSAGDDGCPIHAGLHEAPYPHVSPPWSPRDRRHGRFHPKPQGPESERDCNREGPDLKSTRLNSSHLVISYAVFCLKKKSRQRRARARFEDARQRSHPARAGRHAHPRPRVQGSGREQGRLDHHARHRRPQVPGRVPVRHSDRTRRRRRDERHCELPHRSGAAAREHRLARRGRGARSQAPARQAMTIADGVKAAALLFVATIAQVSIFSQLHVFGGVPQLVLVTLVSVALLRGAVVGALAGFFAGLVVDTATLGQLGLTSLVLTVSGYWIGRYGETTGRDRGHAPFLSVAVVTFLYAFGILLVTFMLGERAPAGPEMRSLLPTIVMNLILTAPTYALVRVLLRPRERADYATEVQLLG